MAGPLLSPSILWRWTTESRPRHSSENRRGTDGSWEAAEELAIKRKGPAEARPFDCRRMQLAPPLRRPRQGRGLKSRCYAEAVGNMGSIGRDGNVCAMSEGAAMMAIASAVESSIKLASNSLAEQLSVVRDNLSREYCARAEYSAAPRTWCIPKCMKIASVSGCDYACAKKRFLIPFGVCISTLITPGTGNR
jgi:hypothetical protein